MPKAIFYLLKGDYIDEHQVIAAPAAGGRSESAAPSLSLALGLAAWLV